MAPTKLISIRGSILLSRLANYHPTRFTKFAWIDVAYQPPTDQKFSVEAINEMTTKALGYPIFAYWLFFNDADAGKLMDDHVGASQEEGKVENTCLANTQKSMRVCAL